MRMPNAEFLLLILVSHFVPESWVGTITHASATAYIGPGCSLIHTHLYSSATLVALCTQAPLHVPLARHTTTLVWEIWCWKTHTKRRQVGGLRSFSYIVANAVFITSSTRLYDAYADKACHVLADVVLGRSYNSRAANVNARKRVSAFITCVELCARNMSYNCVQRFSRGSPLEFRETADA